MSHYEMTQNANIANLLSQYEYPTDMIIQYQDTREYRNCLRRLFGMSSTKYPDIHPDVDDESKDELEFDEDASSIAMEYVYSKTKDHPIFQQLYSFAAARILSLDHQIGMSVLFSYDYLEIYHYCLVSFFSGDVDEYNTDFSKNRGVVELMRRLS
jgi:hypothetical protein